MEKTRLKENILIYPSNTHITPLEMKSLHMHRKLNQHSTKKSPFLLFSTSDYNIHALDAIPTTTSTTTVLAPNVSPTLQPTTAQSSPLVPVDVGPKVDFKGALDQLAASSASSYHAKPTTKHTLTSTTSTHSSTIPSSSTNQHTLSPTATIHTPTADIVTADFSTRYEDEIASTAKLHTYRLLGDKHRTTLTAEAKVLQSQFQNELIEARQIETSVYNISNLLTEFSSILLGQSTLVTNLYETTSYTSDFITDTEKELRLTLERSKNSSRNMILLALLFSVLLLLLDWITP